MRQVKAASARQVFLPVFSMSPLFDKDSTTSQSAKAVGITGTPAVVTDGKRGVTIIIPPVKKVKSSQSEPATSDSAQRPATAEPLVTLDSDIEEIDNPDLESDAASQAAPGADHESDLGKSSSVSITVLLTICISGIGKGMALANIFLVQS